MNLEENVKLAPYTSFNVGGPAKIFANTYTAYDLTELPLNLLAACTVLGYGANVLVSDNGLPGLTVVVSETPDEILIDDDGSVTVDAGCNWDKLVETSVEQGWWGLEFTSGIPGGVGAAVVGNIAAYGQAVKDTLVSIEALDRTSAKTIHLSAEDLKLEYRKSNLQTTNQHLIVLSATFKLNATSTTELTYQNALDAAKELGLTPSTLHSRRQIIMETRRQGGSLLDEQTHTAGSFFRNPIVDTDQIDDLVKYDETGKTADTIKKMNQAHGGMDFRVSAAHVLLAAGFKRGQSWGNVRLHPDHVLKIENTGGASAQDIYNVAQEIISTVKTKLDITLEPEVKFLGEFTQTKK